MKEDNKTHATDTLRDLKDNPKEALKNDFDQTKADMQNVKEKLTGEDEDRAEDDMDMRL